MNMEKLQFELTFDILSRLPVKDLLRCRCVCKSWHKLIIDPNFIKVQFDRSVESDKLSFIYDHNHYNYCIPNRFKITSDATKLDLSFKESPLFLEQIIGSCYGLICFKTYSYGVFVLNPTTRELKNLPELPGYWRTIDTIVWGFGYSYTARDFKAIRIVYFASGWGSNIKSSHVIVHTVRSNSSWRTVAQAHARIYDTTQTLVNGNPHWGGSSSTGSSFSMNVVYFDVEQEVMGEMAYPENEGGDTKTDYLGEFGGCLSVLRQLRWGEQIEIWVMDEYGIKESWNRKFTISHPIIVDKFMMCCSRPLWFFRSGEILVKKSDRVVMYDPVRGCVQEVEIANIRLVFVDSLVTLKGQ